MEKQQMKVGHYYKFIVSTERTVVFAVLYGFERGKNKDVYTVRIFTHKGDFEFPMKESTFERWAVEGKIKEITADETIHHILESGFL